MSQPFRWTLLWIVGSMVGAVSALMMLSQGYDGGQFYPSNPDAVYHARRILDALFTHQPVIQFDPKIHVPEGSWLTWPWGFDQLLTWITSAFGPYPNEAAANRVLMNIPPAVMPIAVGIVVNIARQLKLPILLAILLVLAFAALPTVYMQFGVGNIDHHFAELTFTLGMISAGLWFFREGDTSPAAGIVFGAVLGVAMSIHNGLFILQIPVALALSVFWLRGTPLPDRRQVDAFAISLVVATLLICLPSEPWRRGFFEFYTLSWFHSYIAACVAGFAVILSRVQRTPRNIALVVFAAALALLPIVGTLPFAKDFVSGELEAIRNVSEVNSPYQLYKESGEALSTRIISWFMWVSAPFALLNIWWLIRQRDRAIQYLALTNALGLLLMQMQYRFCVFGAFSMLLTPVLATKILLEARPQWRVKLLAGCAVVMAAGLYPTFANWHFNWILGSAVPYANLLPGFPKLKELCEKRPGVVLSDLDMGHWVRYHSNCSVIADVFLLTPQHARKAVENSKLLLLTPQQLLDARKDVRYVFAYHPAQFGLDENGQESPNLDVLRLAMTPLERDLLGPEDKIPHEFNKRWESRTPAGHVFARLYEIVPGP